MFSLWGQISLNEVIASPNDYTINMLNAILNHFTRRTTPGAIEKTSDSFSLSATLEENKNNKEMSGEKKINGKQLPQQVRGYIIIQMLKYSL